MNKYALTKLLNRNGYLCYNKAIARIVGVNAAVLLAELINISDMFDGNEFFFKQDKLVYDTALSKYQIQEATKTLVEKKVLEVTKKGIPCRNFYNINIDAVLELISLSATRSEFFFEQDKLAYDTAPNFTEVNIRK